MLIKLKSGDWVDPARVQYLEVMRPCDHPEHKSKRARVVIVVQPPGGGIMASTHGYLLVEFGNDAAAAEEYAAQLGGEINRALAGAADGDSPAGRLLAAARGVDDCIAWRDDLGHWVLLDESHAFPEALAALRQSIAEIQGHWRGISGIVSPSDPKG